MKSPVTWLVLLIIILVGALGYTIGKVGFVLNNPLSSPLPSSSPSFSQGSQAPTNSPLPTPSPSPLPQVVEAGGILSFPKFQVTTPSDWTFAKSSTSENDQKLTLTKGGYTITIFEGAFGGNMCLYPNDAPFEGPSQTYTSFVELETVDGLRLRRSSGDSPGYTVCQYAFDSWQAPTPYGHISVQVPADYSAEELNIVDQVLKSLKKL